MSMTDQDILKVKHFCQGVIDKPRRMSEQWSEKDGEYLWCSDWEIIEVCKYLFNGRADYMGDPPPNRLKNNPLWSKDKIAAQGDFLLKHYGNIDDVLKKLQEERESGNIPSA